MRVTCDSEDRWWLFGGEVASVRVYPTAVKEGTESEVEAITELTENNGSM